MYMEIEKLFHDEIIDEEIFSYFNNVGWNKEMDFNFFAPSKKSFIKMVDEKLQFICYEHTSEIYTNLFPIYIVKKRRK